MEKYERRIDITQKVENYAEINLFLNIFKTQEV